MRAPGYPWELKALFDGRPTVGWLMDLCEENYRHLLRLAPAVRTLEGRCVSRMDGSMDLHLDVLEQTPYTTLVHLTYFFAGSDTRLPDPDARVRVYHDSRQVEVVDLRQRALPLNMGIDRPTMAQKWRVNMFLSKWLSYCVGQGHRFGSSEAAVTMPPASDLDLSHTC
ncbi:MAG TPA: DUF1249 domain-containing protein [Sedimenticola thiotaurini]|uniref:DUF1249 domain-containing protein n=1 Tax=Sedimenticola thiotaurini TaxID=1543721 RepID=A0A831WA81_9GAMM|nr:DUF1249 domain-containing protein [Sedimenticola thiotaurini]